MKKPIWGGFLNATSQVVDDTYYFGVGGAFGPSLGYKINLPPKRTSRITKLPSLLGNKITKYGNFYVSVFCYEGCVYSLYNRNSSAVTPLERMTNAYNDSDPNGKEEFLGIDSQGRMILNIRDTSNGSSNQQSFYSKSLAASPLNNESSTITLIKANDLPEKMKGYLMIDGVDKVLMLGSTKAYIYDLSQGRIREIEIGSKLKYDLPLTQSYNYYSATRTSQSICFIDSDTSIKYAINLANETYLDTPPSNCRRLWAEKEKDEIFKELDLPVNLEIRMSPVIFKDYNLLPRN